MAYIGNTPADKFLTLTKQNFSTSATTSYTLDSSISSTQDIALFINNVRQSPVDAYTVSGTALTLTSATAGTDEMYCVYLGKTVGTVSPSANSVTNAMLAGSIDLTSKVTGTLPIANGGTGSITSANNTPAFLAYLNASQALSSATATKISLAAEAFDTNSAYDNSSNYRFTVPSGEGGKYAFSANMIISNTNLEYAQLWLYKNGSAITQGAIGSATGSAQIDYYFVSHSAILTLSATDYVELYGYGESTDSSNCDLWNDGTQYRTFMCGHKLIGV